MQVVLWGEMPGNGLLETELSLELLMTYLDGVMCSRTKNLSFLILHVFSLPQLVI